MLLDRKTFFIKERAAVLKLTDTYEILDPETKQQIGIAKDEPTSGIKYLRLLLGKRLLPTKVNVYEDENKPPVLSMRKSLNLFRSKVSIFDSGGKNIGYFRSKILSLGGGFLVFDSYDRQIAELKGDWKGWNFKLINERGEELGMVTKKWAGIGKELFTTADNYMISMNDVPGRQPELKALLLAAGLAVDIVYKEK